MNEYIIYKCGREPHNTIWRAKRDPRFGEVNAEKTNYMVMSCEQNAGQNLKMKIGNKPSERIEQFQYLGKTLKSQISFTKS